MRTKQAIVLIRAHARLLNSGPCPRWQALQGGDFSSCLRFLCQPRRSVDFAQECTLILTEGDSAKALAVAGLSVLGRDKYGVAASVQLLAASVVLCPFTQRFSPCVASC